MEEIIIVEGCPDVDNYNQLRKVVGWRSINKDMAKVGLEKSLYGISFYHNNLLIAMGRVVGDMGIIFYLQDVIVHPNYQKKGLGNKVIDSLIGHVKEYCPNDEEVMIALMSASGKEEFYEKHGFVRRPDFGHGYGHGMSLLLNKR